MQTEPQPQLYATLTGPPCETLKPLQLHATRTALQLLPCATRMAAAAVQRATLMGEQRLPCETLMAAAAQVQLPATPAAAEAQQQTTLMAAAAQQHATQRAPPQLRGTPTAGAGARWTQTAAGAECGTRT